jgi:hypothetical protein
MGAAGTRLADEYDAAQVRGDVVGSHDGAKKRIPDGNSISQEQRQWRLAKYGVN